MQVATVEVQVRVPGPYEALVAGGIIIELDHARQYPESLDLTQAAAGNPVLPGTLRRAVLTYQSACVSRLSDKNQQPISRGTSTTLRCSLPWNGCTETSVTEVAGCFLAVKCSA